MGSAGTPQEDRSPAGGAAPHGDRPLRRAEGRTVALLGVPTLALALAVTMVTTYLPVVARDVGGSTLIIGLVIGIEGLVALWLPLLAGTLSDRVRTRIGGRLPFLLAAMPLVVGGLALMGAAGTMIALTVAALVFFVGYFVAYEPYRALYPDLLGPEIAGRAQGTQALWRGVGTGCALAGGGLLLGLGNAVPFLLAAAVFAAAVGIFTAAVVRRGVPRGDPPPEGRVGEQFAGVLALVRENPALRAFLVANGLWELSLAALKTFVVLYVTEGLGYSRSEAALMLGGAAILILVAAAAGGKLADRHGPARVITVALAVYAAGLLVPFLSASPAVVAASVPFVAVGGGILMALPYALLIPLMPESSHGAMTGYFSLSRGLGTWLGPLLAGLAITALAGPFGETDGYQAVWGVCCAAAALSMLPLRRLRTQLAGDRVR
jgi:MFS family permease